MNMPIEINDRVAKIDELNEILERVGGRARNVFRPIRATYRPIGESDVEINEVIDTDSGLLIRDGQPVFAYIKDHSTSQRDLVLQGPENRRKLHFAWCRKLEQMEGAGQYESRYRVTTRTDNLYWITVQTDGYESEELLRKLHPCRFCLHEVGYNCYGRDWVEEQKQEVVASFDAKEANDLLNQHFALFQERARNLRLDAAPAGYAPNQQELSRRFRETKGYRCDICGGEFGQATTEMHHIDGDKRNNAESNLQCLCHRCHANLHPHMRLRARRVQGGRLRGRRRRR